MTRSSRSAVRTALICPAAVFVLISVSSCRGFAGRLSRPEHCRTDCLRVAEALIDEADFDGAIMAYERHMDLRLASEKRPADENPYFYLLMIGDVHLRQGKVAQALLAYDSAERKGISAADRYRAVGSWYEDRGELQQAIDILTKYRDRDELLIDAMLDRISRTLLAAQETPTSGAAPPPVLTPQR